MYCIFVVIFMFYGSRILVIRVKMDDRHTQRILSWLEEDDDEIVGYEENVYYLELSADDVSWYLCIHCPRRTDKKFNSSVIIAKEKFVQTMPKPYVLIVSKEIVRWQTKSLEVYIFLLYFQLIYIRFYFLVLLSQISI